MRLASVELEIDRQSATEGAETLQQYRACRPAGDAKLAGMIDDVNFDLITFPQSNHLNN